MGNAQTSASVTIASMAAGDIARRTAARSLGAQAAGRVGGVAGLIVQPAVWVVTGTTPDALDGAIYTAGAIGTAIGVAALGIAAAAVDFVRGGVNDEIARRLENVRRSEPRRYRPFILPASRYSAFGPGGSEPGAIGGDGGTAWKHPSGMWVYITDARGRLICDYEPRMATEIIRPIQPLSTRNGAVRWERTRPRNGG